MKITNRILSILIVAVFLASPAVAGEGNTNLNTKHHNSFENGSAGGMTTLGDGAGLIPPKPRVNGAGKGGIIAFGDGGGATPPKPKSMETNGFCILDYCFKF